MKQLKKIFVCEFITGGGLCAEPLTDSLAREGALMRNALLRDLVGLSYHISTAVDARLVPPHCEHVVVHADDDAWLVWEKQIKNADATWIIAPETEGVLNYLTQLVTRQGKLVLGCGLESIKITSEKMATYLALEKAGIATIPTYSFDNWPKSHWIWLAKPNDGAGSNDAVCFNNADDLQDWIERNDKQHTHVIQPFQPGDSASISCVIKNGKAQLLSCNSQEIDIDNHKLRYMGGVINGMREHWAQFEFVANQIAEVIPDLAGYVGIDVIVDHDAVIVVEINPRLTTSYVGLREAIGVNPAELIINTLTRPGYKWPKLQKNLVQLHV
jgi:predicted ATP-grasp superfamily ATP-dependent carboligase